MSYMMVDVFHVLSCAILFFDYTSGDVCLACTDSPLTRECLNTVTCGTHESCYADAFENPNGNIVFNMGCRDRQLCGSFGKRGVVTRSNGNTWLCAQCCFGNLCNAALCGQTGLPSVGPVCFKCDQALTPSDCNEIALCSRDEVCRVVKIIGSLTTSTTLYKSGCVHRTQCDRLAAQSLGLIGRKRYDKTVMSGNDLQIQCCDSNLCNHGNTSSASGSALTTGAVAPTHSTVSTNPSICSSNPCIHGNCFSGSPDYFCQCEQGWQGKNCDQHQGPCTGSPCVHGNCFENSTNYVCQCENVWTGKNCDQKISYCTGNPCLHGTCLDVASTFVCQCSVGWQGTKCDQLVIMHAGPADPIDCVDVRDRGYGTSGVYVVKPYGESKIPVYCDMTTDGGGWTVIQRRQDGSQDFYKSYAEYEQGFGDVTGEHYLGNGHISAITRQGLYELRIDLEDFKGVSKFAKYSSFSVGDSARKYTLHVDGYYGTAGDSLKFDHDGHTFSAADQDNDGSDSVNCAEKHHGGYWYSACFKSNLNGKWGVPGEQGIVYGSFKDWAIYVLKKSEIKIRRVK